MKKQLAIFILALLLCDTPVTHAIWPFGPSNYEDCILENVKPGLSNAGIADVRRACRNKFPLPLKKTNTFKEPNWVEFGYDDEVRILFDINNINFISNNVFDAWTKLIFKKPKIVNNGRLLREEVYLSRCDCTEKTFFGLSFRFIYIEGDTDFREISEEKKYAQPGSPIMHLINQVCR